MKTFCCFLLSFCCSNLLFAQSNFNTGFLPKIVVSKKLSNKNIWVNSLESRTFILDDNNEFSHSLVDISSIISIKTDFEQSFNFGYILRFRDDKTIHRIFQHYNFVCQLTSIKIAHRIAFEQFYQSKRQTIFRTRYRFTLEKPLSGERVDIKEFYLKLGNELLYDFTDLKIRITPYLGYQISKKDRIEFGLDYRLGEFIKNNTQNDLWFRTTWYISLN